MITRRRTGYVHNLLAGGTLGDIDNKSGRITVVARPTDSIKNVTVFQYSDFGGTEAGSELYSYYKLGQTNNGFALTTTLDTVYGNGLFSGRRRWSARQGYFSGSSRRISGVAEGAPVRYLLFVQPAAQRAQLLPVEHDHDQSGRPHDLQEHLRIPEQLLAHAGHPLRQPVRIARSLQFDGRILRSLPAARSSATGAGRRKRRSRARSPTIA